MTSSNTVVIGADRKSTHKSTPTKLGRVKAGKHVLAKLTDLKAKKLAVPGAHADGGGLYLQITPTGAKSWSFRYSRKLGADKARAREMGLGPFHTISLAEAREKAQECRKLLLEGIDPIEYRKLTQAAKVQKQITTALETQRAAVTFDTCVAEFIAVKRHEWSNEKHAQQFENTLGTYASPVIGTMPVAAIDTAALIKVFERDEFWMSKTETAKRVRQRIEAVLDWAKVMGYRHGDNPARWDGCMEHLLAKPTKIQTVRPMPSLPYSRLPEFITALREQKGVGALALEFAILTAVRTGPVREATWDEIDLVNEVWIVPAAHMKGQKGNKKEHRVPLCTRAIQILKYMQGIKRDNLVFPSTKPDTPLSDMTLSKVIKTMNKSETLWVDPNLDNAPIVPHGFRSTFSTYIAEKTDYPEDLREACLAHSVKNKVIEAYQRGDLLEKRRELMTQWALYAEGGVA